MKRLVLACLAVAAGSAAVLAQAPASSPSDPIAERKALMKSVGAATGVATRMARGQAPFELAKAQEAFKVFQDAAAKMPTLYPETSKTGGDTSASPKIWEDMAGFRAAFAKFGADAADAAAKTTDEATFKTAFGQVSQNCGSCHQSYRVSR